MKGQCTICAENFEEDNEETPIAALPCGHTFHHHCVSQWLETSKTCPHCRKAVRRQNVIPKLYFESSGSTQTDCEDSGKLKNKLDDISFKLRQKEKEQSEIKAELRKMKVKLTDTIDSKNVVDRLYNEQLELSSSLRKQLKYHQKQEKSAEEARAQCFNMKKELHNLKSVEMVIKGSSEDIEHAMNNQGTGENAVKQLVTFNVVLKQELDRVKQDKRKLAMTNDQIRRELSDKNRILREKQEAASVQKAHLNSVEDDLKHAERERDSLLKKVDKLQKAIESPSASRSSLVHRLMHESPAPFQPKLHKPKGSVDIDLESSVEVLNMTPDLFDSPELVAPSPNTVAKEVCKDNNLKFVKITSGPPAKKMKRDLKDISNSYMNYNILKSQGTGLFGKAYNGFGGREKLSQQTKKVNPFKKPSLKAPGIKSLGIKSKAPTLKIPDFPSMDGFIDLS